MEIADTGVDVLSVCPGPVESNSYDAVFTSEIGKVVYIVWVWEWPLGGGTSGGRNHLEVKCELIIGFTIHIWNV